MIKIEKYDGKKTYMYPNGELATPESIKSKFPAVTNFVHIIETDESGQVAFAIQNLAALKSQLGIDVDVEEEEAIRQIEEIESVGITVEPLSPLERKRLEKKIEQLEKEKENLYKMINNCKIALNL